MADFDLARAQSDHRAIITRLQSIRDGLTNDAINYYYDDPTSEDEAVRKMDGLRRYATQAYRDLDALLSGPLRQN